MSITSERQRRLDPVNGGFIYYTLFHADKDERPDYAEVGDIIEEFGDGGKAYKCALNAKGQKTWTEDATWDRQTGGSAGGSAYTLPTASVDTKGGVKIGSGLTMTGEVLSATGGGGAEKFVVTLTEDNDTWTADKTAAEIYAAYQADKDVVCVYTQDGVGYKIPCLLAAEFSDGGKTIDAAMFAGFDADSIVTINVQNDGQEDDWEVESYLLKELPDYSASNNGQVLGVSSGSLAWVNANAPLIVTMTEDAQNPETYVGDKTFGEAKTAHAQGRNVVIVLGDSSSSVLSVAPDGSSVALYFAAADTISTLSGNPTDNITITMN